MSATWGDEPSALSKAPEVAVARAAEQPVEYTDDANAARFVADHGARLRFVAAWKNWLVFDGRRWHPDDHGEVMSMARQTVRHLGEEALDDRDGDRQKRALAHVVRSANEPRLRAMLALSQTDQRVAAAPSQFDSDPMVLNCANGLLDLRTGCLRPHGPEDMNTKLAAVNFDPEAGCPQFSTFLGQILGGDRELEDFLQRWVGYCLTGEITEHAMVIGFGVGANGKSTLVELLRDLLGDYAATAPADTLLVRRDGSASNDVARLRGVRFLAASETDDGRRLSEPLVKSLTGGDTVSARFLYSEFFDFRPQCKIVLTTNHKPVIRGTDDGIWRRIRLVPFQVIFPVEQRDVTLPARLRTELPGILAWAVRGCLAWQKHRLGTAAAVEAATSTYRADSDLLGQFISEECVTNPAISSPAASLYDAYRRWSADRGENPVTQNSFGRRLTERGFAKRLTGRSRTSWWTGIGLAGGEEERIGDVFP